MPFCNILISRCLLQSHLQAQCIVLIIVYIRIQAMAEDYKSGKPISGQDIDRCWYRSNVRTCASISCLFCLHGSSRWTCTGISGFCALCIDWSFSRDSRSVEWEHLVISRLCIIFQVIPLGINRTNAYESTHSIQRLRQDFTGKGPALFRQKEKNSVRCT